MKNIKAYTLILMLLLTSTVINAQKNTLSVNGFSGYPKKFSGKTRWVIGLTPNQNTKKINGLGIGLITGDIAVNGINVELFGIGFLAPRPITTIPLKNVDSIEQVFFEEYPRQINGVSASLFGHYYSGQTNGIAATIGINQIGSVNGLCVAGLGNLVLKFNGIVASVFTNQSAKGRGLQIGLFNTCYDLRGIQIGLWNKNGKRSLPFINWQFTP